MGKQKWTTEEEKILIENYENMKTRDLMVLLSNKSNDQIRWKAKDYKLNKKVTRSSKDITWLENLDSPETCYWWGFITADGCITKKQLILSISVEDKQHLQRFSDLTNCEIKDVYRENGWNPNGYTMSRIAINDYFSLERIRERFSISDKKTYNPLKLDEFFTTTNLKYFIVGLIDGDGHVDSYNKNIKIKIHPNWSSTLQNISKLLLEHYSIPSSITMTKDGWVILTITAKGSKLLKALIQFEDIPYMKRKWDRITV